MLKEVVQDNVHLQTHKQRFSLFTIKSRTKRFPIVNEDGLSTLEWILIVAAVGGLATLGVFIVRNATDASSEQVDGETDQVMTAEHAAAEADMQTIMRFRGLASTSNKREIESCHIDDFTFRGKMFNAAGDFVGNDAPDSAMSILDKWGDTFRFGPKLVDNDGRSLSRNEGYCGAYPHISS